MTRKPRAAAPDDPLWYKDAVIYELHVRAFADSDGDGIGDFRGLTGKLDYLQDLGVTALWLLPFYPSPLQDDGYDIADYTHRPPELRHARGLQDLPARGAPPRPARDHRAGDQPHLRPAPLVPARPPRPPGQRGARLLRVERRPHEVRRDAHHLQGLRDQQLDLGPGGEGLLLAPLLPPPARPQLRVARRCARRCCGRSTSGSTWASTGCASTPSPTSTSARGPTARTCRRRTAS